MQTVPATLGIWEGECNAPATHTMHSAWLYKQSAALPSIRDSGRGMAASIGIRVYRLTVHRRGDLEAIPLDAPELPMPVGRFLSRFSAHYVASVQDNILERSWYFDPRVDDGAGNTKGYLHYGTYGFESNFVDARTRRTNYHRRTSDVEEIPLFYEFWCPDGAALGLLAFQSFQGRSCIGLVMQKLREDFSSAYPRHKVIFHKLMPNDLKGSLYYSAPVKRLTLIRQRASSDITDRYYQTRSHTGIDFEVSLKARRNGSLGPLAEITNILGRDAAGVVLHEGIEFHEATAEIRLGKRKIKVGVFGPSADTGVIDLSDLIVRGSDGHPTFESMSEQSDHLLGNFYDFLAG